MRGDHVVVITIKIPAKLSNEEKVLYQKLYEIQTLKKDSVKERLKGVFK